MANYNGFEYGIIDDEVTITGYTGTTENIVIPDFIDGYPVTIIGERAFLNYYRSSLVLPSQLRRIELGAFAGDNGVLTELIFPKSVEYIGDSAFHFNVLRNVYVYNSDTVFSTMALGDFLGVVIHGFRGSTAYDYAVEYGMEFIPIPLELESITEPDAINIGYDDELTLPESVQVELNSGETVSVNVDWEHLDTRQEGTFTVNGTLRLPGDIGNPDNLQPSVTVTISRYSVASIESVEDIIVRYDEQPELPQSIEVTLDNGDIISVGVSWDLSEFDNQTHGVYEVIGTLQLPDIYANPDDLQPNVTITVVKRYIVSFEAISDATIDHKDVDDFELPTSVVATLDDDETMDIPIEITYLDSFNEETTYGYIYDYRLNNPPSIDNPDELTGKFILTVNKRYITSVSPIEPDSVEFGTGYQSLPMPSLIEVDYNDDTSGYLSIKWDMGTPTYESLNPQDYTFTGTLIIDDDVTYNRDNLTAEMILTLNEKVPKSEKPAMSKEMYVFNADDEFVTIMSRDNGLIDTYFKDHQNNIVDEAFVFTVDNESELLHHIVEENQVAFYDREGDLRLMRIKEIYEESADDGHVLKAVAEPAYLELYDHFIEDRRIENGTAQTALNRALDGSRYIGEVTVQLDRETDNFYWINGVEAVFKILGTWGGALKDTIKINDKNEITERKLWIMARRGSDNGLIVEPDHNAESITRNTLSYPKTAMWGQGSSLEIEDEDGELTGGHTRYITFEDVEWSIANGDSADKPLGQKWIGDPQALAQFGYLTDNGREHRYGHFSNQDYETPEDLLWATWQALQEEKLKEVIHEAKIYEGDKPVNLGDTVTILNRQYNKPIEVQSQITGLEYDILDDDEINIIIGKYVDMSDPIGDELDKIKDDIKNVSNRPNRVTENSYANIKPHRPFNVEAHGGYRQIQIYWTFTDELYVKHYEIYGSQISDFVPSEQNLLWKGNVSAFAHDVEMDEMWYYYVRAVNYHGTPSDYSDRVQANSMRDVSPDIMFGSIKAEQLEDYLDLAGKLDEGTLDWINEDVYAYADELKTQILDDVEETVGTVANRVAHLVERMDDTDDIIQTHEVLIQENHDAILQRVTSQELNAVENTFNQAVSEIEQKADGISQRVEQTNIRIDNIDLGGTNFITHLPDNWENGHINANGSHLVNNQRSTRRVINYFRIDPNTTYTMTAYGNYEVVYREFDANKEIISNGQESGQGGSVTFTTTALARFFKVFVRRYNNPANEEIFPDMIGTDIKVKLSLGEEQTGWTPNLDDTSELVSQVQSYVSDFNQRADSIELSVAEVSSNLEDGIQDLKVNAIAYINISPGDIKIDGDKVTITGETFIENGVIGTAAIANLAVSKAHLKNAIIDDVHINNMSGRKIIAKTITADAMNISTLQAISGNMGTLTAGILRSSNNNMELNLNRGTLRMSNAYFTLGNGARIDFTSTGNRIQFRSTDGGIVRSSGMGVGRGTSGYPFAHVGTTGAADLDSLSEYYSGFIASTTRSISEGGTNSINGYRLQIRNKAVNYDKGVTFDFNGNPTITMMSSANHNYIIDGLAEIRGKNAFTLRNYFNGSSGWLFETAYVSGDIRIRGMNGGSFNYQIGSSASHERIRNIFLRNNPNVSSDRLLKQDFNSLENSADILRELNPISYRYKLTNADKNSKIKRNKIQFGLIYQEVVPTFEKYGYNTSDLNMTQLSEDGLGSLIYQEITPHLIKGWQDHDKLINEIDIRIEDKDRRIKRLEKKVSKLEKAVA